MDNKLSIINTLFVYILLILLIIYLILAIFNLGDLTRANDPFRTDLKIFSVLGPLMLFAILGFCYGIAMDIQKVKLGVKLRIVLISLSIIAALFSLIVVPIARMVAQDQNVVYQLLNFLGIVD